MPTKETVRTSALILNPPQADHWQLGSGKASARFGAAELNPSGDWSDYAPADEDQARTGLDTQNCTNYGTGKALAALAKFKGYQDFPADISERYTGVLTGTTPIGNDPHHVIEVIRTFAGVIPAVALPWSESIRSWEEYYSPNPMAEEFVALGQRILKKYIIGHEWVWTGKDSKKHEKLAAALKRGTVCVSVRAWQKEGSVYTKQAGEKDNHWVWLMKIDGKGRPVIRDQYAPYVKTLAKGYDFEAAKLYFMSPNPTGQTPFNLTYLMNLLKQLLARLTRPREHQIDVPMPRETPVEPLPEPVVTPVEEKPALSWEVPKEAFKLTRIMCDELGLTVEQKNIVCACIYQESRFRNHQANGQPTKGVNRNAAGKITSIDWGIAQVNDTAGWHIGKGLRYPSVEYVLAHPEEPVRWMIETMKKTGRLQPWSSYTGGAYKQWLINTSPMWALKS